MPVILVIHSRNPLGRIGSACQSLAVAETIDRQRSKAFPATAGAKPPLVPPGNRGSRVKARAADEAAAMRKLRACPLADAEVAGFVQAPRVPDPRVWNLKDGNGLRSRPVRQQAGRKSARCHRRQEGASAPESVGQDRASARELRKAGRRRKSKGCRAGLRLRPKLTCRRRIRASATARRRQEPEPRFRQLPSDEPPGLRP